MHANLILLNLYSVCAIHWRQLQRRHMFLTTEAYNEMPTLRREGHLNANVFHVQVLDKGWKCPIVYHTCIYR